jgi:hypothetical protein
MKLHFLQNGLLVWRYPPKPFQSSMHWNATFTDDLQLLQFKMKPVIQAFSEQEYLSIFVAFIYGHITSNIFAGWTSWIQNRKAMKFSAFHILFSIFIFLLILDIWWVSYFRIGQITNSFLHFFLSLVTPIILYILTTLIFPNIRTLGLKDLGEYFTRNERIIYALLGVNFLVNMVEVPFLEKGIDSTNENYFRLGGLAICSVSVILNRAWMNRVLLAIGFAVLFTHMIIMPMPMEEINSRKIDFSFLEYLTIFTTFIYGFVASVFFRGWSLIIQNREIRFSKEHLAWSVLAFCILVDLWWGLWLREDYITTNLGYFILFLLTPLSLYLLAGGLFPLMRTGPTDLHEYFYNNRQYIFSLFGIVLLCNFVVANVMEEPSLFTRENLVRLLGLSLALIVLKVNRVWLHRTALAAAVILLTVHSVFFE